MLPYILISPDVKELFPAAFLQQLEGLHLLARQIARGRQRAERRSVKRGAGLEFADHRPFSPGDDLRAVDWAGYARNRHLFLKLFEEEEDLYVHLLLDATTSMQWGEPSKFDLARQLTAALAYLALANLDRAGVNCLGPLETRPWAPGRGRARFLPLLRYLEAAQTPGVATGATDLARQVARWIATNPRRGLLIWLTDAWGSSPDDAFLALDRLRYARHDIAVIQIVHADEQLAGELGEFEYEDVESAERKTLIVDRAAARQYEEAVRAYEARLAEYCRRHGIAFQRVDAGEAPVAVVRRLLLEGGFVR